jgi:peptidoglycan/LPS O-acetylase OafA/YrhL/lysophospholipase L1-like esterase
MNEPDRDLTGASAGDLGAARAEAGDATSGPHLRYQPALDGLRGLAVAAVLAYHADLFWADGGFLGVDAFFVLSGYLITSLLLLEWRGGGKVALPAFWARRARRLLPALFLLLAGVAVYAAAFAKPAELDRIRGDALATLFYVENWHEIISGVSYFDIFTTPSPLRHAWSLSIEEQFYLVWPLALLALLWALRGSPRMLILSTAAFAGASALLMALLFEPGVDPSRVYYGTDTRAQSLLVGATLAMVFMWYNPVRSTAAQRLLQVAALAAAAGLAWAWVSLPDTSSFLYRGGYLVLALSVATVIAAVVQQREGPLGRALSFEPLRLLGLISYGVYLWHWPIYLTVTQERTDLEGIPLLAVRVGLTIAVAAASYVLLEQPIRRGALHLPRVAWLAAPAAAAGLIVMVVLVTQGGAPPYTAPGQTESALAAHARSEQTGATRVLLVGDSVADSLAVGLFALQDEQGFVLQNVASAGCGVRQGDIYVRGRLVPRVVCDTMPEVWTNVIDQFRPEVVVIMVSGWDGVTYIKDGRTIPPRTPEAEEDFRAGLQAALEQLSSGEGHLVLITTPYADPFSMEPESIDKFNALAREVASEWREPIEVIDLNSYLGPDGEYTPTLNGVRVRSDDNVHFNEEGAMIVGEWLAPRILGQALDTASR